ncbi:glycosyltransferase family 2 protein [Candidatus Woesebacteria bacterium]|nr:glycosyltransferase family 2 protein [Candidatus Woesebacteria bacterium]
MKVSIVIPNFNGRELLEKNLPFVLKAKENQENEIIEIIIVDDGSIDESVNFIRNNFPDVKIIKHKINRGFSATVNTGVRTAKGELITLLNNDVIPSEDFLKTALPHFKDDKVFAVSLHEKGYAWARGIFKDGYIEIAPGEETNQAHLSFWVSGGSGVFRRSYWMKLGGMDEKLLSPFYWEDIDLCYRAAKKGWLNLWEPDANIVHKHESTISKFSKKYVERVRERNQLLFTWKNLTSPNLFRKHMIGLFKRLAAHPGYLRIILMAFFRIGTVLKARAKEKKEGKVSDEAIFANF